MPHSCDESFYTAARASQSRKAKGFTDCTCDLSMLILLLLPLLPDRRNQGLCNTIFCENSARLRRLADEWTRSAFKQFFWLRIIWTKSGALKKSALFIFCLNAIRGLDHFMLTVRYGSNTLNPDSILVMKITLPIVTQLNHWKIATGKSLIVIWCCMLYRCN